MKKVRQTRNELYGDCFQACLASLLEIDLNEVPAASPSDYSFGAWDRYLERIERKLLRPRGLTYLTLPPGVRRGDQWWIPPGYYITAIKPEGSLTFHAVVAKGRKIVWDPLAKDAPSKFTECAYNYFLIPLDPSKSTHAHSRSSRRLKTDESAAHPASQT